MNIKALVFSLLLGLLAQARSIDMTDNGPDVKIPSKIWNQFGDSQGKESISFMPLTIRLEEKTQGVLTDPEIEIKLPRGGGQIDLSQFVQNQQGTFRVFFDFPEVSDSTKLKAFFISRSKKRKLGDEVWGAGCNKFMDIKNYLFHEAKQKGIEVNTTRGRHITVLGGTFFFGTDRQVTQVTFVDSQQPQLFCESGSSK